MQSTHQPLRLRQEVQRALHCGAGGRGTEHVGTEAGQLGRHLSGMEQYLRCGWMQCSHRRRCRVLSRLTFLHSPAEER